MQFDKVEDRIRVLDNDQVQEGDQGQPLDQEQLLGPVQQEEFVLYTPMRLRSRLLRIFDEYRDKKLPNSLKVDPETAKVPAKNLGWGSWFQRGIATVATAAASKTRTHAVMTTFVAEEIDRILSDRYAAPLTKMTNLTILFYGLLAYMRSRHSKDLYPELQKIKIWPLGSVDEGYFTGKFLEQIESASNLIHSNLTATDKAKNYAIRFPGNPLLDNDEAYRWEYQCTPLGQKGVRPMADMGDIYYTFLETLNESECALIREDSLVLDSPVSVEREERSAGQDGQPRDNLDLDLFGDRVIERRVEEPVAATQEQQAAVVDDGESNSNDPDRLSAPVFK